MARVRKVITKTVKGEGRKCPQQVLVRVRHDGTIDGGRLVPERDGDLVEFIGRMVILKAGVTPLRCHVFSQAGQYLCDVIDAPRTRTRLPRKSPSVPLKTKGEERKATRNDSTAEAKATITAKTQGQRLDAFIKLAGLTKKEFSDRTGVPYCSLKKVIAGTTRLTEENIDKIRKVTNIFIPSLRQEKTKLFCWPVVARRRAA